MVPSVSLVVRCDLDKKFPDKFALVKITVDKVLLAQWARARGKHPTDDVRSQWVQNNKRMLKLVMDADSIEQVFRACPKHVH